jgi:hypothetical protein
VVARRKDRRPPPRPLPRPRTDNRHHPGHMTRPRAGPLRPSQVTVGWCEIVAGQCLTGRRRSRAAEPAVGLRGGPSLVDWLRASIGLTTSLLHPPRSSRLRRGGKLSRTAIDPRPSRRRVSGRSADPFASRTCVPPGRSAAPTSYPSRPDHQHPHPLLRGAHTSRRGHPARRRDTPPPAGDTPPPAGDTPLPLPLGAPNRCPVALPSLTTGGRV